MSAHHASLFIFHQFFLNIQYKLQYIQLFDPRNLTFRHGIKLRVSPSARFPIYNNNKTPDETNEYAENREGEYNESRGQRNPVTWNRSGSGNV